ncbi:MAG: cadmium-translocating P-type ATPase [Bryobacterales bacterium]|nr:cadmium-translocating P-type ATPase [Bryobacterales bacterium]
MDCAEEVSLLRRELSKQKGVTSLGFNIFEAKMTVQMDPRRVTPQQISEAVARLGMRCETWRDQEVRPPSWWTRRGRAALTTASGVFLAGAMLWHALTSEHFLIALLHHDGDGHRMQAGVVALCLLAILCGAWLVAPKAWSSLRRRQADMNVLVITSMVGASVLGEWIEGATLAFLFALAGMLESWSLVRARNAVGALIKISPQEASVVHGDHEHRTPVELVPVGARVRIRPGERVPCDGVVESGESFVDQALITGESVPVQKRQGKTVYAGTMNGDGVLEIRSTQQASDTTLARMVRMVGGSHHRRAASDQFVEKFARIYTPAVFGLAFLVGVVPPLFFDGAWTHWFYQSMVILLISCPCALVISTPVSIVAALASAARNGVLVKGGVFLEAAAKLRAFAFDKTGVLTQGEPTVIEVVPVNGHHPRETLARLAALERSSEHPIGRAIEKYARQQGVETLETRGFRALQGKGAEAEIRGDRFWAGSPRLASDMKSNLVVEEASGNTVVACGSGGDVWALVRLEDSPRPEAADSLRGLRKAGIQHIAILTGDVEAAAAPVARKTGADEVHAGLLPDEKAAVVDGLIRRFGRVAMVGDGVNDALAMARSSLGIALATRGAHVAMEAADVVLMSSDLRKLPFLLLHARRTVHVIQQNIVFALAIKAVFLAMAFAGVATLWMAVAADMGATLLVTFNGLRLLRARA